jgi:hypothetical protein
MKRYHHDRIRAKFRKFLPSRTIQQPNASLAEYRKKQQDDDDFLTTVTLIHNENQLNDFQLINTKDSIQLHHM